MVLHFDLVWTLFWHRKTWNNIRYTRDNQHYFNSTSQQWWTVEVQPYTSLLSSALRLHPHKKSLLTMVMGYANDPFPLLPPQRRSIHPNITSGNSYGTKLGDLDMLHVRLAYKPYFFSQRIVFFSHNKRTGLLSFSHIFEWVPITSLTFFNPKPSCHA